MKIIFKSPKLKNGTIEVSLDGGVNYNKYVISEVLEDGIILNEDQDLSLIKIKGQTNILSNANVISSIKVDDSQALKFITNTSQYGWAFPDCVEEIVIQNGISFHSLTYLSHYPNLKNVTIPGNFVQVHGHDFEDNTTITNVVLKNGITYIGEYAFSGCSSLTNIIIPDSVTEICEYAFSGCSSLTNVVIPNNINIINDYTFEGCESIKNIVIPNSVTKIGLCAFSGCKNLESLTIPKSVERFGQYSFIGCSNLATINYGGSEEEWIELAATGGSNFQGCPYESITFNYNYEC